MEPPQVSYDTLTLEQAYERVRAWYQANLGRIQEFKLNNAFELRESPQLIRSLPPTLSKVEMRAVLDEVLDGVLEWGRKQSDGSLSMESYAHRGLEVSGGRLSDSERTQLKQTPIGRLLRLDYHKDAEEERAEGHRRYDSQFSESNAEEESEPPSFSASSIPSGNAPQTFSPSGGAAAAPAKAPILKQVTQKTAKVPSAEMQPNPPVTPNPAATAAQTAPAVSAAELTKQGTATPKTESRSQVAEAPPTPKIISDQWVKVDLLGYQTYARTLANLITHEDTHPPLTISLEAPWGAGKTSVMKMLQDMLDGEAALTEENKAGRQTRKPESEITLRKVLDFLKSSHADDLKQAAQAAAGTVLAPKASEAGKRFGIPARATVWFNAWKYQSSEQLWAGLAHCIINHVTVRMDPMEREYFWLRLNMRRVDLAKVRREIYQFVVQKLLPQTLGWLVYLVAAGIALAFGVEKLIFKTVWPHGALIGGATGAAATLAKFFFSLRKSLEAKASEKGADLLGLVREPDYEGKMGFLYLVESDVREVLDLVATPKKPLVIFIDDLDRCVTRKVAEVVEAISLFLAGDYPNCIFVLGMEPRMVAAALQVSNKELIEKMDQIGFADGSAPLGWRFMEKIVQLPLVLPSPTNAGLLRYLDGLAPDQEAPGMAAAAPVAPEEIHQYTEALQKEASLSDVVKKTEELMATVPEAERRAIAEASKRVYAKKFVPHDPLVRGFVESAIEVFGANPRQVKRYVNMFRFCCTLRYALWLDLSEEERHMLPADAAITKYVVMSVQWPQAAVLLRQMVEATDGRTERKSMLECLEMFAAELQKQDGDHDQKWREFLDKNKLDQLKWSYTPSFRRHLSTGPSLCEGTGRGLW